eukprot:TRINITY_DN13035_c0_g1_i1.p1 TRINITY_DN13035_c0_g1~~TRINITY_DN13035_c0_g1_i1.p1  ORF type:complete len:231 (-),score=33.63 TRINITY_DN13035_c0_g1_i1:86-778(-)
MEVGKKEKLKECNFYVDNLEDIANKVNFELINIDKNAIFQRPIIKIIIQYPEKKSNQSNSLGLPEWIFDDKIDDLKIFCSPCFLNSFLENNDFEYQFLDLRLNDIDGDVFGLIKNYQNLKYLNLYNCRIDIELCEGIINYCVEKRILLNVIEVDKNIIEIVEKFSFDKLKYILWIPFFELSDITDNNESVYYDYYEEKLCLKLSQFENLIRYYLKVENYLYKNNFLNGFN